ncbi:hypothetical protein KR018_005740, partial [Drosophila ironensis]
FPHSALPKAEYNPADDSLSLDYDLLDGEKKPANGKSLSDTKTQQKNNEDKIVATESRLTLSPVSQLLLEMEEKEENHQENHPVARRTRSSRGRRRRAKASPVAAVPGPEPETRKRRSGGRKSAAQAAAPMPSVENSLQSIEVSNRRRDVAEIAARAQVLDCIDMVSPVVPRVEGYINLDSDDECPATAVPENALLSETENPTIEVALSWLGEIQIYKLRLHQKFHNMFKEMAERNQVNLEDVSVDMYYKFIDPNDTPHSVGLKSFHTLTGHATKSQNNNIQPVVKDLKRKSKRFQVKVQADKWKQPRVFPMGKKDSFKILYFQCAEELNCDARNIKLFFDGELLDPEDTPLNQDMEGNEMIDLTTNS